MTLILHGLRASIRPGAIQCIPPWLGRCISCQRGTTRRTWAKAIRLVRDRVGNHASGYDAIRATASRLGMNPETLRKRIRQDEIDHGDRDGITAAAAREIRELKRKNAELEQTIEILKAASFFVLESDPRSRR
jgi:transposase